MWARRGGAVKGGLGPTEGSLLGDRVTYYRPSGLRRKLEQMESFQEHLLRSCSAAYNFANGVVTT